MEETKIIKKSSIGDAAIAATLKEVMEILEEKGYDPIKQVVGYLMSGDPGYISSHKEARKKLTKIERTKIIDVLVRKFTK